MNRAERLMINEPKQACDRCGEIAELVPAPVEQEWYLAICEDCSDELHRQILKWID